MKEALREMFTSEIGYDPSNRTADFQYRSVWAFISKVAEVVQEKELRLQLDTVPEGVKADQNTKVEEITQGFVTKLDKADVRVRKSSLDGTDSYTMTAKYRPDFQEMEMTISKEMYEALLPELSSVQTKTRYKWSGWDIDEITQDDRQAKVGEVWAEFELQEDGVLPKIPESWKADKSVQELVEEMNGAANEAEGAGAIKTATLIDALANELGL